MVLLTVRRKKMNQIVIMLLVVSSVRYIIVFLKSSGLFGRLIQKIAFINIIYYSWHPKFLMLSQTCSRKIAVFFQHETGS